MTRGTTPVNTFQTDADLSDAQVIYITYSQKGRVIIEKQKSDLTIVSLTVHDPVSGEDTRVGTSLSVTLTQQDTLAFMEGDVDIQIRARFYPETGVTVTPALASDIITVPVKKILKEGVI